MNTIDAINQAETAAKEAQSNAFAEITKKAMVGDGESAEVELMAHNATNELVTCAAWLARDLADVLEKIAAGHQPMSVGGSDLFRRIIQAETVISTLRKV